MNNLYILAHDGVDHASEAESLAHQSSSITIIIVVVAAVFILAASLLLRFNKSAKKRQK